MATLAGPLVLLVLAVAAAGSLGCGGAQAKKGAEETVEARAKARLLQLFDLARAGKDDEAAAYVVYRGADPERSLKDVSRYWVPDEKAAVDSVCRRVRELLQRGKPTFVKFQQQLQEEGMWLVWLVAFGEGREARQHSFSCLETKEGIAVLDVD